MVEGRLERVHVGVAKKIIMGEVDPETVQSNFRRTPADRIMLSHAKQGLKLVQGNAKPTAASLRKLPHKLRVFVLKERYRLHNPSSRPKNHARWVRDDLQAMGLLSLKGEPLA